MLGWSPDNAERAAAAREGAVDDAPARAEDVARAAGVSTATVSLAYAPGAWGGRLKGFGFVVDRREARAVVAGVVAGFEIDTRAAA